MDKIFKIFIVIFIIIIILSMIYSIIKRCCRRKQENVLGGEYGPTLTVSTTTTHVAQPTSMPQPVPPYPIMDPRHPTPHSAGPPAPGFGNQPTPYPPHTPYQPGATPYPPVPVPNTGAPYPPTSAYPPTNSSPYYQSGDPHANPPPYDVAVANPPVQPLPTKEAYSKQSPFNPHY